jgi:hypothetical protein
LLIGHPGKQTVARDAGVVYKDIQVFEFIGNSRDHRANFLRISDVRFVENASST